MTTPESRRPRTRRFIRLTATLTLAVLLSSVTTAYGEAAPVVAAAPEATDVARTAPAQERQAPTYQERQELIAERERPLLPEQDLPLDENGEEQETICVSSEFTTLGVLYDSIYEGLVPNLPAELQRRAPAAKAQAHRDMQALHVSRLSVSNHPMALGADRDDPAMKYRDPLSQYIVVQLLNIRDGKAHEAISVENLTVAQAVETVWLYLYATVLRPIATGVALLPPLGSPFEGIEPEFLESITYNTLLRIFVTLGSSGLSSLYSGTSTGLIDSCLARVTAEQRDQAGQASEDVTYDIHIPQIVQDTANQLALADSETCAPIGSLPLSRIVTRTSEHLQSTLTDPQARASVQSQEHQLLTTMRGARVHHNLIPADPADFTALENLASSLGSMIPFLGGAPLNIMLGLGHNLGEGADFAETVSIADLTVTKSLTAAHYSYAIAIWLVSEVPINLLVPGDVAGPATWVQRILATAMALPLNYGLVVYHNVIRSMCFVEDDEGPVPGRGAEANRETETTASSESTSSTPGTSATPSSPTPSSPASSGSATPTTSRAVPVAG